MAVEDRWPPAYDQNELASSIRAITLRPDLEKLFFEPVSERTGPLCQGDILALTSGVPVIEGDGVVREQDEFDYWLTIGNTCDVHREEVIWTQIVPIRQLVGVTRDDLADLRAYRATKRFYVPSWPGMDAGCVFAADFLLPVPMEKAALGASARVVARFSRAAWFLLNGCLVRFLARSDGRLD